MSLLLLEVNSIAFDSRKTPVPFDNGQGFPYFPTRLSQRKLIPDSHLFHRGLKREMEFRLILWSLVTSGL